MIFVEPNITYLSKESERITAKTTLPYPSNPQKSTRLRPFPLTLHLDRKGQVHYTNVAGCSAGGSAQRLGR